MSPMKHHSYRSLVLAIGVMGTIGILRALSGCYTANVDIDTMHPDGSSSATEDLSSLTMNGPPDMTVAAAPDMKLAPPDLAVPPPDMTVAAAPDMKLAPPDMTGSLPDMTSFYSLVSGFYRTTSVSGIMDGCGLGLTAATLTTNRTVYNDAATGNVILTSAGGSPLGSGPVRSNSGTLTYDGILTDSACQWRSQRSVQLTLTADNTFTMTLTDIRSDFMTVAGGPGCFLLGMCQIMFTADMVYP